MKFYKSLITLTFIFLFIFSTFSFASNTSSININSRSAIVIDRNSKSVLFEKNAYNKVKMASTTKIMTAIIVLENSNLNDIVTVSAKAGSTGGSRLGLKKDDKISIHDLLYGLLLCSGNDAAVALAEQVGGDINGFATMMNNKALKLNLFNTHFVTPHGLDNDEHYTTAYELALLSDYALHNNQFKDIVSTKYANISINGTSKSIHNTNELLGIYEGIYGIKTGFTNGANRCLVTACKKNNLDVICIVLGADTKSFRTNDSIKLLNYVYDNYEIIDISKFALNNFNNWKSENINSFYIQKKSNTSMIFDLKLQNENQSICIPIKKNYINLLEYDVSCQTNLIAPLYKDTKIGNISVYLPSQSDPIYFDNILIKNDIYEKNIFEYFSDCIRWYSYYSIL